MDIDAKGHQSGPETPQSTTEEDVPTTPSFTVGLTNSEQIQEHPETVRC